MHIIIIGSQGSGKGTQADLLESEFGLVKLSTGDLFRRAIEAGSELGIQVEQWLNSGSLVPDEITLGLVESELARLDAPGAKGIVFDGFPRTKRQAESLDQLLDRRGETIQSVIELSVPEDVVIKRLAGRRVCRNCGATYHVDSRPPAFEGVCDKCGGELYQRDDDKPDAIRKRLGNYKELTRPLLDLYRERGIVNQVDGNQDVQKVHKAIVAAVAPAPVRQ
jgi:adenylate kinase